MSAFQFPEIRRCIGPTGNKGESAVGVKTYVGNLQIGETHPIQEAPHSTFQARCKVILDRMERDLRVNAQKYLAQKK